MELALIKSSGDNFNFRGAWKSQNLMIHRRIDFFADVVRPSRFLQLLFIGVFWRLIWIHEFDDDAKPINWDTKEVFFNLSFLMKSVKTTKKIQRLWQKFERLNGTKYFKWFLTIAPALLGDSRWLNYEKLYSLFCAENENVW